MGILNTLRNPWEFILKITLGRNSAVNNIIKVEIIVWMIRIVESDSVNIRMNGSSTNAITIPYITNAILFPINMVTMYCPGFWVNIEITLEDNDPCFLSISSRNLFDETNAISIPEKKAEKSKVIKMAIK